MDIFVCVTEVILLVGQGILVYSGAGRMDFWKLKTDLVVMHDLGYGHLCTKVFY